MPKPPTIDVHAHVLLPEILGACGAAGPELTERDGVEHFRAGDYVITGVAIRNAPMADIDLRLRLMDRLGIDKQILSPYPMLYFYDQPLDAALVFNRRHNDAMAAVVRLHRGRLAGFACLPMQDPDAAVGELRRAVLECGLVGSYIGCRFGARELSDFVYDPLWAEHVKLNVPMVIHPGPLDGIGRGETRPPWDLDLVTGFSSAETTAIAHMLFSGALDRHEGLRVVVPHGGGFAPYVRSRFEIALAKRAWGKGLLHRPFAALWDQLVFDCLVHDAITLDYLVRAHGADRIVLGTNFAAWDQDDGMIDRIAGLAITDAQKAAILGRNAKHLFAL